MPDNTTENPSVVTSNIHPAFASIVGQETVKSALSMSIAGVDVENELIQPVLLGPPGVGKTEIARAYGKALANKMECRFIEIGTPKDIRNVLEFEPFFNDLIEQEKFVCYIDEVHEMEPSKVSHAKLIQLLRKGLDRQNEGKCVPIVDRTYVPSRKNKVFILATNHPNKVDSAIMNRCSEMRLSLYDTAQIREISANLFKKHNLIPESEQVLNRIAVTGRGTARPIVNLIRDHLEPMCKLESTQTVTNEHLMLALRNASMYPSGLNKGEIDMLQLLEDGNAKSKNQILVSVPTLDGMLSHSIAYMLKNAFVKIHPNGAVSITTKGKKYLKVIDELGFLV